MGGILFTENLSRYVVIFSAKLLSSSLRIFLLFAKRWFEWGNFYSKFLVHLKPNFLKNDFINIYMVLNRELYLSDHKTTKIWTCDLKGAISSSFEKTCKSELSPFSMQNPIENATYPDLKKPFYKFAQLLKIYQRLSKSDIFI